MSMNTEVLSGTSKKFKDERYLNGDDDMIACRIVYANEENALFYDAEHTVSVEAKDVFNLFIKGVVAVKGDVYYAPTSCTEAGVIVFPFA